jgi:CheY-like chemotaxis protein
MMTGEVRTCDVRELFSRMKETAFCDVPAERFVIRMPEYVPPAVLAPDAEHWMMHAGKLIRSWTNAGVAMLATAHYEDHRDPSESCIVFSIDVRQTDPCPTKAIDSAWLQEIDRAADELLVRSIALGIDSDGDSVVFEFRLPVHRWGTRRLMHRDTILLVEDDRYVLRAGQEVLELSGYRVVAVTTAEDALLAFDDHRESICLVISDVTLPKGDGKQLAKTVHTAMPGLPVLLVSGYSEMECEDAVRRLHFLAKPFNGTALLEAAKRCLSARDARAIPVTTGVRRGQESANACC